MSRFKITPSMLSSYQMGLRINQTRYYYGKIDSPEFRHEQALELVTRTEPNEAMKIGSAVHQYIETGNASVCEYDIKNSKTLDDLRKTWLGHEVVAAEVRMQRELETNYGTCVVSGMADVLDFDYGIDWKVSVKSRSASQYFDSVQAFAYLWLFDVPKWFFITLKADFNAKEQVIESVKYGSMIKVPATNQTEPQLVEWADRLIEELNYHNLLDRITIP